MITVFLVRHGQSQANAGFATPDPAKVELTPLGVKQAKEVAAFLKTHTPPKLIVTSPYLRSKQTAEPTRFLFPNTAVEEWEVQEFTYLSSIHRMCSTVQDRKPLVDGYWTKSEPSFWDDFSYTFKPSAHSEVVALAARAGITADFYHTFMPGTRSESFKVFIWRVQAFIRKLNELDNRCQNIAVFSHEQFIAAVLWCLEYKPNKITEDSMRNFREFFKKHRIPNGGIVELEVRHNQVVGQSSVITRHLPPAIPGPEPIPKWNRELVGAH